MPTYEYECRACHHRFELFQNMSDDALTECPQCDGGLRRLIGAGSGIISKGVGVHVTDYGSTSTARGAGLGASCDRARPCCGRDTPCDGSLRKS